MEKNLTKILFSGAFLLTLLASGCENIKVRFFSENEDYKKEEYVIEGYTPIAIPLMYIKFNQPRHQLENISTE